MKVSAVSGQLESTTRSPENICRRRFMFSMSVRLQMALSCVWDTLAERLRRRPAKPMGSARVGSNPTGVVFSRIDSWSAYVYVLDVGLKSSTFDHIVKVRNLSWSCFVEAAKAQLAARSHNPKVVSSILTRRICLDILTYEIIVTNCSSLHLG